MPAIDEIIDTINTFLFLPISSLPLRMSSTNPIIDIIKKERNPRFTVFSLSLN
jgi:hypothetical protein